ncbi:hypothetical protein [Kitasatospora cinereorecta]|uniref:WXG100 family type VII secretion target n=1 Tax=Kitasatospora cinereorecta TaxID=285560 RepID=A0ABW0VFH5_9ACTN
MITPPPATYAGGGANATIQVDAELLLNFSKQILVQLQSLSSSVSTIFATLKELELGWAGQTAEEAQEFFARLEACLDVLYGKPGDKDGFKGSILGRVAQAMEVAGDNYLAAEDFVVDLFYFTGSQSDTNIWNAHNGKNPPSGNPNPTINDPNFTAISETY